MQVHESVLKLVRVLYAFLELVCEAAALKAAE